MDTAISESCSSALLRIIGEKMNSKSVIETVAEMSMTIKNIKDSLNCRVVFIYDIPFLRIRA